VRSRSARQGGGGWAWRTTRPRQLGATRQARRAAKVGAERPKAGCSKARQAHRATKKKHGAGSVAKGGTQSAKASTQSSQERHKVDGYCKVNFFDTVNKKIAN
jgi:hypothetical protein